MIYDYEVRYTHLQEPNSYNAYYHGALIGAVVYTPKGSGTWTFTSSKEEAQTFGSTRLQAVGFYVEQFMEGEREYGKEE